MSTRLLGTTPFRPRTLPAAHSVARIARIPRIFYDAGTKVVTDELGGGTLQQGFDVFRLNDPRVARARGSGSAS